MAVSTRAQILTDIANKLADNSSGDISAQDARDIFTDIVDTFVSGPDDPQKVGFKAFDSSATYTATTTQDAARVFYDGKFWILKPTASPFSGPFDATKWTQVNLMEGVDQAAPWEAGTTYALGDVVSFDNRIWQSLQNSNTGNIPSTSPGTWQEISPSEAGKVPRLDGNNTSLLAEQACNDRGHLIVALAALGLSEGEGLAALAQGNAVDASPGLGTRTKIYAHERMTLPVHNHMHTPRLRIEGGFRVEGSLRIGK